MDWNDLRYFLAALRTGSIAGAGRRLKVDASTVGRRIAALEEALDARLFDRTPDGLRPTAAAEAMVAHAEVAEQAVCNLQAAVSGADRAIEGLVRVATTDALAAMVVLPALAPLREAHPGLSVEVVTATREADLLKREADIALRVGARPRQQSLVVRRVGDVHWGLYATPAVRDRARRTWIGFDATLAHVPAARWLAANTSEADVPIRLGSPLTMGSAAVAGWGVALLPDAIARGFKDLVALDEPPIATSAVWIVVHPELQHLPRLRVVIDRLVAALG